MTVTHPLQDATRARAATEPGFAFTLAYKNKMRGAAEQRLYLLAQGFHLPAAGISFTLTYEVYSLLGKISIKTK